MGIRTRQGVKGRTDTSDRFRLYFKEIGIEVKTNHYV